MELNNYKITVEFSNGEVRTYDMASHTSYGAIRAIVNDELCFCCLKHIKSISATEV